MSESIYQVRPDSALIRQGFFNDCGFPRTRGQAAWLPPGFHPVRVLSRLAQDEIASLRWEDVDGDVIRLRPENAKNGEARPSTLGGELGS